MSKLLIQGLKGLPRAIINAPGMLLRSTCYVVLRMVLRIIETVADLLGMEKLCMWAWRKGRFYRKEKSGEVITAIENVLQAATCSLNLSE